MDKETAQQKITELVKKFHAQQEYYKSDEYNETQCREDFINPLFAALGWDIENKENLSPTYRAVRLENRLVGDGTSRSLDYSFWIGKDRVFVVEAKKPSVNLGQGTSAKQAAFQLRRYGWSANLAVSIVTNFKELVVYDCTKKPSKEDQASTARLNYLTLADYTGQQKTLGDIRSGFDYLWEIFGYENVRRGGLERYTKSDATKKGILTVDDSFLQFLEDQRKAFAVSLFRTNKNLTEWELNFAVQQILDRIVFLRFAEDRGIEPIGGLFQAVKMSADKVGGCYRNLYGLFELADDKYNSGMFDMSKDPICRGLVVENGLLIKFVRDIYFPSPYDFQAMPVEILGNAYERFLGKVIRISGRGVSVEEKPEVRKAGGVYYTPQYIVNYIVENTVGKLLEGKTPKEAAAIKIVDPACGSGSFLLGAYQYLLDWHHNYYAQHLPLSKGRRSDPLTPEGDLTIEEKKRILANNIFGVDLDSNAVEFTKMSLLLKCMEGETSHTLERLKIYHERLLPNIDGNIRHGNSLIESDFYQHKNMSLWSDNDIRKINAFDWHKAFPKIFKSGGFDCVIGNPPYVRQETLDEEIKQYFQKRYKVHHGTADLYTYFIERGIGLLKEGGGYAIIVSNKWLRANYGEPLRKWLKTQNILEIIDFGDLPVFGKVTSYPMILCITKSHTGEIPNRQIVVSQAESLNFQSLTEHIESKRRHIDVTSLDDTGWQLRDEREKKLFDKLMAIGVPLKNYVAGKILFGIKTGLNEAFIIDSETRKHLIKQDKSSNTLIKPIIWGREIKRYAPLTTKKFLIFIPKGFTNKKGNNPRWAWRWFRENYPAIANHLEQFVKPAQKRRDQGDYWWELRACDYYHDFEMPKIIFPDIASHMQATFDTSNLFGEATAFIIPKADKYLLALLNSRLIHFLFSNISATIRGGYLRYKKFYLERLPIYCIDERNKKEVAKRDKLIALVDQMLAAKLKQYELFTDVNHKRIAILDSQIDALVYELYGLSDTEIAIIEGEG